MFFAAFNNVSVLSRRYPGKLPVLLLRLSCLQSVSRNAYNATVKGLGRSYYYHFKVLCITRSGIEPVTSHIRGGRSTTTPTRPFEWTKYPDLTRIVIVVLLITLIYYRPKFILQLWKITKQSRCDH